MPVINGTIHAKTKEKHVKLTIFLGILAFFGVIYMIYCQIAYLL